MPRSASNDGCSRPTGSLPHPHSRTATARTSGSSFNDAFRDSPPMPRSRPHGSPDLSGRRRSRPWSSAVSARTSVHSSFGTDRSESVLSSQASLPVNHAFQPRNPQNAPQPAASRGSPADPSTSGLSIGAGEISLSSRRQGPYSRTPLEGLVLTARTIQVQLHRSLVLVPPEDSPAEIVLAPTIERSVYPSLLRGGVKLPDHATVRQPTNLKYSTQHQSQCSLQSLTSSENSDVEASMEDVLLAAQRVHSELRHQIDTVDHLVKTTNKLRSLAEHGTDTIKSPPTTPSKKGLARSKTSYQATSAKARPMTGDLAMFEKTSSPTLVRPKPGPTNEQLKRRATMRMFKDKQTTETVGNEFPSVDPKLLLAPTAKSSLDQIYPQQASAIKHPRIAQLSNVARASTALRSLHGNTDKKNPVSEEESKRHTLLSAVSHSSSRLLSPGIALSEDYARSWNPSPLTQRRLLTFAEVRQSIMASNAFAAVDAAVLAASQTFEPPREGNWRAILSSFGIEDGSAVFSFVNHNNVTSLHGISGGLGNFDDRRLKLSLSCRSGQLASRTSVLSKATRQETVSLRIQPDTISQSSFDPQSKLASLSSRTDFPPLPKLPLPNGSREGPFEPSTALKREIQRSTTKSWFGLNPQGDLAILWDVLMLIPYIAALVIIPAVVAFPYTAQLAHTASIFFSLLFAIDTLIRITTYRLLEPLPLFATIRMNARKPGFLIDLITCIPFTMIAYHFDLSEVNASKFLAVKLLRLHRINSLLHVRPLFLIVTRLQLILNIGASAAAVISVLVALLVFFHLQACLTFWMGSSNGFSEKWWTTKKVLSELPVEPQSAPWWQAYTFGIWSAVSNILPVTSTFFPTSSTMQWTFLLLAALNAGLSAALTGSVAAFYSAESGSMDARYRKKMDELTEYLSAQKLSDELQQRMSQSIQAKYQGKMFDEASILAGLNPSLRKEVSLHNCGHILEKIDFLQLPADDPRKSWLMRQLSVGLRNRVFVRNETIYKQHSHGTSLFMIIEGYAIVRLGGMRVGHLTPGSYFGELGLIAPGPRFETVIAITQVTCMELDRQAIGDVLEDIPEISRSMNQLRLERIKVIDELCESVLSEGDHGIVVDEL
ncbi:hypothetical protein DFJ73DRAFT_845667 [Zopfochytrium polystomum]|nr:hypothetical protein DFJ73DRAFT_845667 [Zopfochytrium polystomum]